jgi:NhaP-type Na+/H+ or K+/H+ antiporter
MGQLLGWLTDWLTHDAMESAASLVAGRALVQGTGVEASQGQLALVIAFAITLVVALLASRVIERNILSTAILFMVAGFAIGSGVLGYIQPEPTSTVSAFIELALFSVLFTDGMRISRRDIEQVWHLSARALLLGLPLTLIITAVLGHWLVELPWSYALLLGAVLSPTDPVLAAAIIGREEVPSRLRQLLNVESGLNDALTLPIVLIVLFLLRNTDVPGSQFLIGAAVGVILPWLAVVLSDNRYYSTGAVQRPLYGFALGLLVLAFAKLLHGNLLLAGFIAGVTASTVSHDIEFGFHEFGELVTELLKLASLLLFGALILLERLTQLGVEGFIFVALVLIAVRPLALSVALLRSGITWHEWLVASWFGPKGFASMLYGLFVLRAGLAEGATVFNLTAAVIIGSVLLHSSTDALVARWYEEGEPELPPTMSERAHQTVGTLTGVPTTPREPGDTADDEPEHHQLPPQGEG